MALINTAPAARELTVMEQFDKVSHRNRIRRAVRTYYARGNLATRYDGAGEPLYKFREITVGRNTTRYIQGLAMPLPK